MADRSMSRQTRSQDFTFDQIEADLNSLNLAVRHNIIASAWYEGRELRRTHYVVAYIIVSFLKAYAD